MQIAVQGDFLRQQDHQLENDFLYQVLLHLARKEQPDMGFLFSKPAAKHALEGHGNDFLIKPPSWLPIKIVARSWWYQVQIPGFLKKQQAIAFISEQQLATGPVPGLWLATTPRAIKLAANQRIIAPSTWAAGEMSTLYGIPASRIITLPAAPSPLFQPLDWETKENVKMQYAEGSEYFFFYSRQHTLSTTTHLLKAFSLFKKWQKSSMKLLLVGVPAEALPDIESYKYRNDVGILPQPTAKELALLTASAYAMVYPVSNDAAGITILNAMASRVPVVASNGGALPEAGGDAALYAPADDFAATGRHMIQLYKDEALCNRLAAAGHNRVAAKSWQESAAMLWQAIQTPAVDRLESKA